MLTEPISPHIPALPSTPGEARSWGQRRGEKKKMWASGFAVLGLTPQAILFRPRSGAERLVGQTRTSRYFAAPSGVSLRSWMMRFILLVAASWELGRAFFEESSVL